MDNPRLFESNQVDKCIKIQRVNYDNLTFLKLPPGWGACWQGGQSHGLSDCFHRLYKPVIGHHRYKRKIVHTSVIQVKFHAVRCKKTLVVFCTILCKSFSWVRCSFPDYLRQLKCVPNSKNFYVFSSVVWSNLGNYSIPGRNFEKSCAEKYEGRFALYRMKFDLVL